MATVTVNMTEACDCCGSDKKCFQQWTATHDCDTGWALVAGDKRCKPAATGTSWTGSGCVWTRWVPMSDDPCTGDSDCSGLADTTEPAPPFGGDAPPGCCPCLAACGCFNVGATAAVSFDGVENGMPCTLCGTIWAKAGTLMLGTYTLSGIGCAFGAGPSGDIFDVASDMGAGCPPDADFTAGEVDFHIDLGFDVVSGDWTLAVFAEDFQLFFGVVNQGDCTGPLVFENQLTAYDPCGTADPQTFAVMINGTATVVFSPCVAA